MRTIPALAVLTGLLLNGNAHAAQRPIAVDLELVIAVDVSFSMGMEEQRAQRDGYVEAFLSPQVISAISAGALGRIAVTYVEWGGSAIQVVPWTIVDSPKTAFQFAVQLRNQPLRRLPFTSISNTLAFARQLIRSNNYWAPRRVIDLSGDGPNNAGAPAPIARNAALAEGITIDGLPIMLRQPSVAPSIPDIDVYYRECVIGGDGAFLMKVTELNHIPETIRKKLVTEISGLKISGFGTHEVKFTPVQYATSYNCFVGEELQEQ